MSYQNYFFDLYGTLVDVHTDEEQPLLWQRLSVLLGTEGMVCDAQYLKEKYRSGVKRLEQQAQQQRGQWAEIDIAPVFREMLSEAGYRVGPKKIAQIARLFRVLSLEKLRLFDGAADLLARLRASGKQIYLLSNAQALFTLPELRALGLHAYFNGVIISSNEGLKKPDPRLYQLALQRYGLDPAQTVMVGNDDRADCWGAARAGLDSMYICTEQSPCPSGELPVNCRLLERIGDVF